jgi:hypothetical protein
VLARDEALAAVDVAKGSSALAVTLVLACSGKTASLEAVLPVAVPVCCFEGTREGKGEPPRFFGPSGLNQSVIRRDIVTQDSFRFTDDGADLSERVRNATD